MPRFRMNELVEHAFYGVGHIVGYKSSAERLKAKRTDNRHQHRKSTSLGGLK